MRLSFTELERVAYIRNKTQLARACAAADDNARLAEEAQGLLEVGGLDLENLAVAQLPAFLERLRKAQDFAEKNEPKLTLEV